MRQEGKLDPDKLVFYVCMLLGLSIVAINMVISIQG